MREHVVGARVECDGHRGTVLFVGEVPPTKGSWLGVEWDDPSRGKHGGSHEGVQYFVTREKNAGSFIRVNKIKPSIEFCQALAERYMHSSTSNYADTLLISELKAEMNAPFLELVGFDKIGQKQSNLDDLRIAVLDHMCISHCNSNLKHVCPRVEELDISSNLFDSWSSIASFTQHLSNLAVLNVSDNRLTIPDNPNSLEVAFRSLRELNMGQMGYTWAEIILCSKMWPQVEKLAVPNNKITFLEFMNQDTLSNLKVLNLEGNKIENWEQVNKLGQLPNLEQLSLYGCGLKNIQVKENSFRKLHKLSISNNKISQWSHISELDKIPTLVDLKFYGNQGLEVDSYETFTQWVIARIGNLKVFNGREISAEDRRGAELDYLKHHGREYLFAESRIQPIHEVQQSFHLAHPRYKRLVEKFGPPEQGELEITPFTLKNTLIVLQLISGSHVISKKLPLTMEVQKLKTLCHRLFELDTSELALFSYSSKNPELYVPLDNDHRPLSFYSIENGDVILVKTA